MKCEIFFFVAIVTGIIEFHVQNHQYAMFNDANTIKKKKVNGEYECFPNGINHTFDN